MDKFALTNVRVFDGERLLEPGTVVIDGDRIGTDPAGARTVDGDGRALLPGLIDCHIHLTDDATLVALARNGVTTGLDMGTWPPELVASLRGRAGVTDVRSSGTGATHPASMHAKRMGRAQGLVADPDEAKAYVAQRVAEGVDYIKIIVDPPGFDEATVRALVDAAHAHGLRTIAHAANSAAVLLAQGAGVDVLTHAPIDRPLTDDEVAATRAGGTGHRPDPDDDGGDRGPAGRGRAGLLRRRPRRPSGVGTGRASRSWPGPTPTRRRRRPPRPPTAPASTASWGCWSTRACRLPRRCGRPRSPPRAVRAGRPGRDRAGQAGRPGADRR